MDPNKTPQEVSHTEPTFIQFLWMLGVVPRPCPLCREKVHPKARRCPECLADLPDLWANKAAVKWTKGLAILAVIVIPFFLAYVYLNA